MVVKTILDLKKQHRHNRVSLHTISDDYRHLTLCMITESKADVGDMLQRGSSRNYEPILVFFI